MLPNFLGIGAPRCGSTWLHEVLSSHPRIFVPTYRKEVHFFNRHYDRGTDWYEGFFPDSRKGKQYTAVGEITPTYMYHPEGVDRIRAIETINKLIVILRHPIDKANSGYRWAVGSGYTNKTFDEYAKDVPAIVENGNYFEYIEPFLNAYGRNNVLILISEESFKSPDVTMQMLGMFLEVDWNDFSLEVSNKQVNKSSIRRFPKAFNYAHAIGMKLREHDLNWLVNMAKTMGVRKLFGQSRAEVNIPMETQINLCEYYQPEITKLESYLGRDIESWKEREAELRKNYCQRSSKECS